MPAIRPFPSFLALPLGALTLVVSPACRGTGASSPAAAPVVQGFSPDSAYPAQAVTIKGTGFTGAVQVTFGGSPALVFKVESDALITATVPPSAVTGTIAVRTPRGAASSATAFTVIPVPAAPVVTGFEPPAQAVGKEVTLTGSNFTGATGVTFGGTPATAFKVVDDATLVATVPPGAGKGLLTVVTPGGPGSSNGDFTATPPAPTLGPLATTSGAPGTAVILAGTGFTGATAVVFGGGEAPGFTVDSDAQITVQVPTTAATGPVSVRTPGGVATTPETFTVLGRNLAAADFAPTSGTPGATVTVRGANLDLVKGVTLGGAAAPGFTVAPGGASLTFDVPPGAASGPVILATAGAPVTVPGGNFTVSPAVPAITALTPASGVPGAEVVLEGSGLGGTTQVTFAGLPLNSNRFDIEGDTRVRVRIPDDAQAGGVLALTTPGGTAAAPAFALLASRREILPRPLEKFNGTYDSGTWVNFPAGRRSAIYDLNEPMAPVFHAYHPSGDDGAASGNRPDHFFTRFTLNLKLPPPFFEVLPAALKAQIAALGLDPANVDILCVSQDYQYDGTTPDLGIYLFRPHYWTDPEAPASGKYVVNHNLQAAIFEPDAPVTLSGHGPGDVFTFGITTHGPQDPTTGAPTEGQILVSGNSEPMAGFDVSKSTGLWSLTRDGARAAATLHLLFNDEDQATLDNLALIHGTVQELGQGMSEALGASRGVQMLGALFRPVVAAVTESPAGDARTLTLTGTCLGGASGVLVDGAATGTVQALSDAVVKVTLPAGTTGNLQVVTPMGTSDPVPLPAS